MKHSLLIILLLLAMSCTRRFYIAPEKADCAIGNNSSCFLIKNSPDDNWVMIGEEIKNFDYERNYIYRLKVKKIKTIDDFGNNRSAYELVEVLAKEPFKPKRRDNAESGGNSTRYALKKITVDNKSIKIPSGDVFIILDEETNKISGKSGCNNFSGTITFVSDDTIELGPISSTKMACEEEINKFENDFLQTLQNASQINDDENEIIFYDSSGSSLVFRLK